MDKDKFLDSIVKKLKDEEKIDFENAEGYLTEINEDMQTIEVKIMISKGQFEQS